MKSHPIDEQGLPLAFTGDTASVTNNNSTGGTP